MDAILSWRWCVKSIISAATQCLCPFHFRVWLTGNSPEVTSLCYGFPGCSPNSTAVNWIIEVCLRSNNLRWIWCFCLGCIYLSQFIVLFLCHAILWIFHWDVQCRSGGPDDLVIWICSAAGCPGTPLHRAWQVVGFDECTACGLPFITGSPPGICAVHLYVLYIISRILDKAVICSYTQSAWSVPLRAKCPHTDSPINFFLHCCACVFMLYSCHAWYIWGNTELYLSFFFIISPCHWNGIGH